MPEEVALSVTCLVCSDSGLSSCSASSAAMALAVASSFSFDPGAGAGAGAGAGSGPDSGVPGSGSACATPYRCDPMLMCAFSRSS